MKNRDPYKTVLRGGVGRAPFEKDYPLNVFSTVIFAALITIATEFPAVVALLSFSKVQ